jgi:hypothetical protein
MRAMSELDEDALDTQDTQKLENLQQEKQALKKKIFDLNIQLEKLNIQIAECDIKLTRRSEKKRRSKLPKYYPPIFDNGAEWFFEVLCGEYGTLPADSSQILRNGLYSISKLHFDENTLKTILRDVYDCEIADDADIAATLKLWEEIAHKYATDNDTMLYK